MGINNTKGERKKIMIAKIYIALFILLGMGFLWLGLLRFRAIISAGKNGMNQLVVYADKGVQLHREDGHVIYIRYETIKYFATEPSNG